MANISIPVVAPKDLGRGIKRNEAARKYEVDLDVLVDNKTLGVEGGKLVAKGGKCHRITNMNTPVPQLGESCFFGNSTDTINLPRQYYAATPTQPASTTVGTAAGVDGVNQEYDFVGWQIASDVEFVQYVSNGGVTWSRSNDGGMNADGTMKVPNGWTEWRREENVEVPSFIGPTASNGVKKVGNDFQLDYNTDDFKIEGGKLRIKGNTECIEVTDIRTLRGKFGVHCVVVTHGTLGVPKVREFAFPRSTDTATAEGYPTDFTEGTRPFNMIATGFWVGTRDGGYLQISEGQGANDVMWGISCEGGNWGSWQRLDNVSVPAGTAGTAGTPVTASRGTKKVGNDVQLDYDDTMFKLSPQGKLQFKDGIICTLLGQLAKRAKQTGDQVVVWNANGCALVPFPTTSSSGLPDFTCKLPYRVESEAPVGTVNGRIVPIYQFTNEYDNPVSFNFSITDGAAAPYTVIEQATKISGPGTVTVPNLQQGTIRVDNLPAGGVIKFSVPIRPQRATRYTFGVNGLASTSGGNNSGLSTCGNMANINVLDGGN